MKNQNRKSKTSMLPTGTVTFLFTDIEGSTMMAQKFHNTMPEALEKHHLILKREIEINKGFVFKITGDAFCCAFERPEDALLASVDIQRKLFIEKWSEAVIKVRIGIHTGAGEWTGNDYEGYIALAITQRIMSSAYGGQVLISATVFDSLKDKKLPGVSFRDFGSRRLKDLIQPVNLYQIVSEDLQFEFPPLKTLDARPNNLPIPLTSFIGRGTEISDLKKLLSNTKLLTLIGTGGTGKTRLSLQVGADVIDDFANGVWFVELDSLSDPDLLTQKIAKALGIAERPKQNPEESVSEYLRDKELLLILDNCEHLIEVCSKLVLKLLSNSQKLKIIATSREAMRIRGEQTHTVLPLAHPEPGKNLSAERLKQYESVRLFIERALSVNPHFIVNSENVRSLSQICIQLDGIPLAIELAAARIKALTLDQICERLENRFKLLTSGNRTALPRQQTLKALVDWSYDLLNEHERILLNRLSVFSGGWTLEAAEKICSNDILKEENIFDLLTELLEKSLIIFEEDIVRYRMLETIKQYSREKLSSSDELKTLESKHLDYFMKMSEFSETKLNSSEQDIWLEKLEPELSNFNEALNISLYIDNKEYGLRLSGSLGNFWIIHGHLTFGRLWYGRILKDYKNSDSSLTAKALIRAAKLAQIQGETEYSKTLLEDCLNLMIKHDDKNGIALTLKDLGSLELYTGELEKAQELYEKSLLIYRELGDKTGISSCLNNLGNTFHVKGDIDNALNFYEESLSVKREIGDKRAVSSTLVNLGVVLSQKGDRKARPVLEESLVLCRQQGNISLAIACLINLSNLARNEGEYEESRQYATEGLQLARDLGEKQRIAQSLLHLGQLSEIEQDDVKAKDFYELSLSINREIRSKHNIAICLNGLGNLSKKLEQYNIAKIYFKESLELFREVENKDSMLVVLLNLAFIAIKEAEYGLAEELYSESLIILKDTLGKSILAETIFNLIEQIKHEIIPKELTELMASIENSVQIMKSKEAL